MEKMLKMINLNFMSPTVFVLNHKHICYCEAIILPDGRIGYIQTSHQNCLIKLYMNKFKYSYDTAMIVTEKYIANFMEHLLGELNVVSVWYNTIMYANEMTEEQIRTIQLLEQGNVLSKKLIHRKLSYKKDNLTKS